MKGLSVELLLANEYVDQSYLCPLRHQIFGDIPVQSLSWKTHYFILEVNKITSLCPKYRFTHKTPW